MHAPECLSRLYRKKSYKKMVRKNINISVHSCITEINWQWTKFTQAKIRAGEQRSELLNFGDISLVS